ncbi:MULTISPECIES: FadR/GntR family transcriptional regulator [unclassified Caballeronia]|uniref:FadR/GntR family transcriptional regulator n=1 Tax=unclassified Caballeronia TaxID=2646786 RepID=UPI001FD5F6ED|nr:MULTISPECIES: FadR/GntR family transcriptional regulator [unclassified Caballeronia]
MTFQPVHSHAYARVRLSDVVSGQIRQLISNGTLLPGQRLPAERDLAEQLNVSRPSLREALIRLESDGFIRAAGRGGFVVSDVTAPLVSHPLAALLEQQPDASADVLELRHGLETLATAYAAERATDADLARIAAAFDALQAAVAQRSTRIAEKDAAFHLAIADATHNIALTHVMHGLNEVMRESMLTSHRLVDYDDAVEADLLAQHRAMLDAIVARDPARARDCAGAHLDYVRALYRDRPAKKSRDGVSHDGMTNP